MRAKMEVSNVEKFDEGERVSFRAVGRSGSYPKDGSDEDNTFAKFTPSGDAHFYIANPALHGQFEVGQKFYVDFSPADGRVVPGKATHDAMQKERARKSGETADPEHGTLGDKTLPPGAGEPGSSVPDVRIPDSATAPSPSSEDVPSDRQAEQEAARTRNSPTRRT